MMTPERRKEIKHIGYCNDKAVRKAIKECFEEIDLLKEENNALVQVHGELPVTAVRKLSKALELLVAWRKWRGKDVTYTGKGDNPSPFGATCAFLDGEES